MDIENEILALWKRLRSLEGQSTRALVAENVERFTEDTLPAAGQAAHIVFVTDALDGGLTYIDNGTDWQPMISLPAGTVATLQAITPTGNMLAYATDGRKSGEWGGEGTGVPVYFDTVDSIWRTFYDNEELQS